MAGGLVMVSGSGDDSYDQNSSLQGEWFEQAKDDLFLHLKSPALLAAVERSLAAKPNGGVVCVADFGCSTGRNSISSMSQLVTCLKENVRNAKLAADSFSTMVFFSDLPANDFNNIFRLIDEEKKLRQLATNAEQREEREAHHEARPLWTVFSGNERVCAATAAGSFYDGILPMELLHVASCNIALHWMSCDPLQAHNEKHQATSHDAMMMISNPNSIWYDSRDPDSPVTKAYEAQGRDDLRRFLMARAQEMVSGGVLLMLVISEAETEAVREDTHLFFAIITEAWQQLTAERKLPAESLQDFNFPVVHRTVGQMEQGIEDSGNEFRVLEITPFEAKRSVFLFADNNEESICEACDMFALHFKSVCLNLLQSACGREGADLVFGRIRKLMEPYMRDYASNARKSSPWPLLRVALQKR